jgi:uncharacterized surface protein with fasciclin (FAS1) repeats
MRKFFTTLAVVFLAATTILPAAAQEDRTVVDALIANESSFSTLITAAQEAGLVETLSGEGPFTVFAPTDGAFQNALAELGLTADELLADTETLTSILTYHVVPGDVSSTELVSLINEAEGGVAELETVNGATITAELVTIPAPAEDVAEGEPTPEPAFTDVIYLNRGTDRAITVTATDISATNGVVHAISNVLLPPEDGEEPMEEEMATEEPMATEAPMATEEAMAAEEPMTIVDVAAGNEDFSTLVAAVDAAGLVETLSGEGPFTVFAPTNAAFEEALAALDLTAEELLADTETLTTVLTYHVVPGNVDSETLINMITEEGVEEVDTVLGEPLSVAIEGDSVVVGSATVTMPDVEASNGVIHVIDSVLLPPSMTE